MNGKRLLWITTACGVLAWILFAVYYRESSSPEFYTNPDSAVFMAGSYALYASIVFVAMGSLLEVYSLLRLKLRMHTVVNGMLTFTILSVYAYMFIVSWHARGA